MIRTKKILILALLFPIVILFALTLYKKHILSSGYEVTLPITGYDPRDLLSGHYIIYTVEYGVPNICSGAATIQEGYVCLDNKNFSWVPPNQCRLFIRGTCSYGRFNAGIEKYYIPENKAKHLDEQVRAKTASIIISISPSGQAQVKDLLIKGQSWREY